MKPLFWELIWFLPVDLLQESLYLKIEIACPGIIVYFYKVKLMKYDFINTG